MGLSFWRKSVFGAPNVVVATLDRLGTPTPNKAEGLYCLLYLLPQAWSGRI